MAANFFFGRSSVSNIVGQDLDSRICVASCEDNHIINSPYHNKSLTFIIIYMYLCLMHLMKQTILVIIKF